MLELREVSTRYGPITMLRNVSLAIGAGEIACLLGPNGAGKTTLIRTILGIVRPESGSIWLEGTRIDLLRPHQIVARGVAHMPEGRQLFPTLTVRDNFELGSRDAERRRRGDALELVFTLFPRLRERERQLAGTLSGGEQQMCAIGRGLMARPRLLLLDEPSLGLAPVAVKLIFEILQRVNRDGTTILLVEQTVPRALQLSHRGYVIENGRLVLEGTRESLLASPHVKQAYLGL